MRNKVNKQMWKKGSHPTFVTSKDGVSGGGVYSQGSNLDSVFSNFAGFFMLVGFISAGFYYFLQPSPGGRMPASVGVDDSDWESRAWQRSQNIQMDQEKKIRKIMMDVANQLKQGMDDEEISKPDVPMVDVDPIAPPSRVKSIVDGLTKPPFNPDIETPEDIVRRKVSHDQWLAKYLEDRNERERIRFIKHFIRSAREQGYDVEFQGGMKFILIPIDKEPEEKLEEAKVYVE